MDPDFRPCCLLIMGRVLTSHKAGLPIILAPSGFGVIARIQAQMIDV